jgi:cell division protein FtsZ
MAGMGYAVMGTATAAGERRTMEAAQRAIASPLLEAGAIDGAAASHQHHRIEFPETCRSQQACHHRGAAEDTNIIFGAVLDEK